MTLPSPHCTLQSLYGPYLRAKGARAASEGSAGVGAAQLAFATGVLVGVGVGVTVGVATGEALGEAVAAGEEAGEAAGAGAGALAGHVREDPSRHL